MWGAQNIDAEVNNSARPPVAGCSKNTQEAAESKWKIPKKVCAHDCAHRADQDDENAHALQKRIMSSTDDVRVAFSSDSPFGGNKTEMANIGDS